MRRFQLVRNLDVSGISGTGIITEGIEFSSGRCVMEWLTDTTSLAVYNSIDELMKIHGHNGGTTLEWLDN